MKSIGQVAKEVGVSDQTLREWEKAGLIPKAKRQYPLARWRVWDDKSICKIKEFVSKRVPQAVSSSWDSTGLIFFTGGNGYGLTPELATVSLGKREEVEAFLAGEPAPLGISGLGLACLEKVKKHKEHIEDGRKQTVKSHSVRKLRSVKIGNKRIRLIPGVKH